MKIINGKETALTIRLELKEKVDKLKVQLDDFNNQVDQLEKEKRGLIKELIEKEENNYSSGYFGLLQICASELDVMIKQMNETLKEAQFYDDFGQPDIDINGN